MPRQGLRKPKSALWWGKIPLKTHILRQRTVSPMNTRDASHISSKMESLEDLGHPPFNSETDRVMICGS